jgi:hypothetical protein
MRSRLPSGYRSLLVCDTHRAQAWCAALARRGVDACRVETAADQHKGSWEVGVAEADVAAARAFVADVTEGRASLRGPWLTPRTIVALVVVVALIVMLAIRR